MKNIFESIDKTKEFESSPAYADYMSILDEINNIKPKTSSQKYPEQFYHDIDLYIKYGPFQKIGKGSSRSVYGFNSDPRYVLKFAHNDNGLRQNKTEINNAQRAGDYKCIVRILTYDTDGIFIVEDRCKESTFQDWYRIIGISPTMLSKIIKVVFEKRSVDNTYSLRSLLDELRDFKKASVILKKTDVTDEDFTAKDYPKIINCIENLVAASTGNATAEKWEVLYDLFKFYFDNGLLSMIPDELLYIDQWGVRSGKTPDKDSLIIIDPGVDQNFMTNEL